MGSPVSPIVVNLHMEAFEGRALSSFANPPHIWLWYVDDVLAVIKRAILEQFFQHINSQNKAITFTHEREQDTKLPMLDVDIHRNPDGTLSFQVFRKPTHTDQFLLTPPSSTQAGCSRYSGGQSSHHSY